MTAQPKRWKDCANSQPIGPPPITAKRWGRSVKENTVSLVKYPTDSKPCTCGCAALAPVAIAALLNRKRLSFTSTECSSTNRADPKNTSTPKLRNRTAESWWLIPARIRRIRAITAAKSISMDSGAWIPKGVAPRISATTRAERITHLEGTQPTFRQSPPMRFFSINATFKPSPNPAAPAAITSPAVPAPITTKS